MWTALANAFDCLRAMRRSFFTGGAFRRLDAATTARQDKSRAGGETNGWTSSPHVNANPLWRLSRAFLRLWLSVMFNRSARSTRWI